MPLPLKNTLQGAWAKYDRAVEDLAALNDEARRFLDTKPYGVDIEFEEKTGWYSAHSSIREEPPPRLGVLVGAIAHQCLSTLNHVVWALAVRKLGDKRAGKKRMAIAFPICETASEFRKRQLIAKKYISQQAIAALEGLQPYVPPIPPDGARHDHLFLIKDLADADKHRVLAAGYGRVDLNGLWRGGSLVWDSRARGPTIQRILSPPTAATRNRMVRGGTQLARIRFEVGNADANVRMNPQPTARILVRGDKWQGITLEDLQDCIGQTNRCLMRLAVLFPKETWPPAGATQVSPGHSSATPRV
jgi:hypothetical protein